MNILMYPKLLILVLTLLILGGCGTKRESFEPLSSWGKISYDGRLPSAIIDVAKEGATLKNGQIITKEGLLSLKLPEGYTFLGDWNGRYLASSKCEDLIIVDEKGEVLYRKKFDVLVASASFRENMLAVVLGDNSVQLIDIESDSILFQKSGGMVFAHDSRIATPYFLTSLLIFPTLDGRLLVFDLKKSELLRNIVVKSEKFFSNVIFLDVLEDRLVAATRQRVVSISPKSIEFLDEDIRDVITLNNRVIIFTKDGRVILSNADLKVLKSEKFKFATFVGASYAESVYIVERGGFLIELDSKLALSKIYELPSSIESSVFITNEKLFFKDKYFILRAR